jgi:hypothetical protein
VDEREKNCDTFKRRVPLGERLPGDGFAREYGVPGFTDAVEPILHGYGGDGYGRATHGITRGVCGACEGLPLSAYRGSPELHYASTAHHAPGTNRPDFSRSAASFLSFYSNSLASHFIVRGCQKSKIPVSEQKRFFDTHGFWNDPQLCCVHDEVKQPTHMQSI